MSVTLKSPKMRGFLAFKRVYQENKSDLSVWETYFSTVPDIEWQIFCFSTRLNGTQFVLEVKYPRLGGDFFESFVHSIDSPAKRAKNSQEYVKNSHAISCKNEKP